MKRSTETPSPSPEKAAHRRTQVMFLAKFLGLLTLFFVIVAPKPVNSAVVEPFTAVVAKVGGLACRLFGEKTEMIGTVIRSPRFAVNILNGCNGLETIFIYAAAVLAFPAPWKVKLLGLIGGFAAIQLINTVRIVSLFYTGIYFPKLFEQSHMVIWQAIVILCGVVLWIFWAAKYAVPTRPGDTPAAG